MVDPHLNAVSALFLGYSLRAVIFDLFGTLVKQESERLAHEELSEYLSKRYGINKRVLLDLYSRYESRGMLPKTAILKAAQDLIPNLRDEEVKDILRKHVEFHAAFTIPYEDAVKAVLLTKEKVGHIAVVTDAEREVAESVLASLGVLAIVDVVVTPDDAGERKPSPKPFLRALELLGTPPDRAVSIGDSCKDIEASRSAGIRAVLVKRSALKLGCEREASAVASSLLEAVDQAVNLLLGQ